jgi:hypothetical protein
MSMPPRSTPRRLGELCYAMGTLVGKQANMEEEMEIKASLRRRIVECGHNLKGLLLTEPQKESCNVSLVQTSRVLLYCLRWVEPNYLSDACADR